MSWPLEKGTVDPTRLSKDLRERGNIHTLAPTTNESFAPEHIPCPAHLGWSFWVLTTLVFLSRRGSLALEHSLKARPRQSINSETVTSGWLLQQWGYQGMNW